MNMYIKFQQELIYLEFTNTTATLSKRTGVAASMQALSSMFFNFAHNVLSNWTLDNHIPISYFGRLWLIFINPLEMVDRVSQDLHGSDRVSPQRPIIQIINPQRSSVQKSTSFVFRDNETANNAGKEKSRNQEFLDLYVKNCVGCFSYIFGAYLIKVGEIGQCLKADDIKNLYGILELFNPEEMSYSSGPYIFKKSLKVKDFEEYIFDFVKSQSSNSPVFTDITEHAKYTSSKLVRTRVLRIISILENFSYRESDSARQILRKIFEIKETHESKINPGLFLKQTLSDPKIQLKKYDFPLDSSNGWEEPLQPTESKILFWMA
jgi:hypothetical protein